MKKLFMMVALMLSISNATFAEVENNEIDRKPLYAVEIGGNDTRNFNFEFNYKRMGSYLELNKEEDNAFRNVHKGFCSGMALAANANNMVSRNGLIKNALDYEVKNMKFILSEEQYRKFITLLNTTLVNRGFNNIVAEYYCHK